MEHLWGITAPIVDVLVAKQNQIVGCPDARSYQVLPRFTYTHIQTNQQTLAMVN